MLKKYACSAKMKNIEEETLDITNLATTVALTTIKHLVLVI